MTENLEAAVGDYDGTGTDASQIFHEDDPTFVGPPSPSAAYGRRPSWYFGPEYSAGN